MAINNNEFVVLQFEALSIRYFIIKYAEFENIVKHLFRSNLSLINETNKQMLYFYLAGIKHSSYIEYTTNSLKTNTAQFLTDESFAMLSLSQIIKIQRQNHLLKIFDFNIPSIMKKSVEYEFTDCCIKLLSMRNKLAHEMSDLAFDDKDTIELLSNAYIKENSSTWFSTLDTELMSNGAKQIFSNIIMLDIIIKLLHEQEVSDEHKTVDNH